MSVHNTSIDKLCIKSLPIPGHPHIGSGQNRMGLFHETLVSDRIDPTTLRADLIRIQQGDDSRLTPEEFVPKGHHVPKVALEVGTLNVVEENVSTQNADRDGTVLASRYRPFRRSTARSLSQRLGPCYPQS